MTEDRITLVVGWRSVSETAPRLAAALSAGGVAAVRLAAEGADDRALRMAADACRAVCHAQDIAFIIEHTPALVAPLGLDGVHVDASADYDAIRREIGPDAILGVHCGASRHDGLIAGEAGASYVAFDAAAGLELFQWWSEMIELPVIADLVPDPEAAATLGAAADFISLAENIWAEGDPAQTVARYVAALA